MQIFKTFISFIIQIFKPNNAEEINKDKEIEYERNQWGYWK